SRFPLSPTRQVAFSRCPCICTYITVPTKCSTWNISQIRGRGRPRHTIFWLPASEHWSGYFLAIVGLGVFGFPAHGGGDAGASAGMVEEDELFDGAGIEFAIFAEHQVGVGLAVRLLGCVKAVHISFELHGAGDGVVDRRHQEG